MSSRRMAGRPNLGLKLAPIGQGVFAGHVLERRPTLTEENLEELGEVDLDALVQEVKKNVSRHGPEGTLSQRTNFPMKQQNHIAINIAPEETIGGRRKRHVKKTRKIHRKHKSRKNRKTSSRRK
jgi:hypothetical protein